MTRAYLRDEQVNELVSLYEQGVTIGELSDRFGGQHPNVEFISLGDSREVVQAGDGIQQAIGVLAPGATVVPLIDRDDQTDSEVTELREQGVRVLTRGNIEPCLTADEVLEILCASQGSPELAPDIIRVRDEAVTRAAAQGKPTDDFKIAAADVKAFAKRLSG